MGTRSMIAIQNPYSKDVRAIYCHWDGYLEHNGAILLEHYSASPKVNNLIALGDLSSLGKEIGEKRPFSKFEIDDNDPEREAKLAKIEQAEAEGWCNYYTRDRGEDAPFKVFKNLSEASEHYTWSDYYYCFKYSKADDYQSGEWFYKQNGGRWKKLAPAIKELDQKECA
jgi:hypothetical protein